LSTFIFKELFKVSRATMGQDWGGRSDECQTRGYTDKVIGRVVG